ncbi:MAG TPA: hypothetical protein VNT99_17400 [Methylomirabilota bacterium]|nr:hypothetical protein [Methylomirabilota bacterium]
MTQGETLFYLREIHTHWCTSNISTDKLAELETAKLIERNAQPVPVVRLTSEGARWKNSGRPQRAGPGIGLTNKRKVFRRSGQKKTAPPLKRLV